MKIYRLADASKSDSQPHCISDAFVFLSDENCIAVAPDGTGKILMRNCDADGVRQFIEDAENLFPEHGKTDAPPSESSDDTASWREWIIQGDKHGWLDSVSQIGGKERRVAGAWINHQAPVVMSSNPVVEVKPYNDRTWAVYLDGSLLCVTLYRRGALAVQRVIEDLGQRALIHEERRSDPAPFA